MIGKTISHYEILEQIGQGGMGVVYKARDSRLDRLVALKFLPRTLVSNDSVHARFLQEARAASALNHANVCGIHAIEECEGQQFIDMEYVDGVTLRHQIDLLRQESSLMRLDNSISYAIQIAEALQEAHSKGVIHRDLKPENIMVNSRDQIKVMDFGLAKLKGTPKLTSTSDRLGTVAYATPENLQGNAVDSRSDIFAFGIVLYELLTGRTPFHGDNEARMIYSILNDPPDPILNYRSDVPQGLLSVLSRTMEKDPDDRYQSVNEMIVDLRRLRGDSSKGDTSLPIGIESSTTAPRKSFRKLNPRTRFILYAILALLIVSSLIVAYDIWKPSTVNRRSIAVLPFRNLNASPGDEYFSDGVTEDIITQLSKIADLTVISRTSMMRYKNTDKSLRDIGNELGVATILEGSLRRDGNQVRIVAQLIDAGTDTHLWAETYDKEMTKIFAIQSDVAQEIARALEAKLSAAEKEHIEKNIFSNTDAYNLFLQSRYFYDRRGRENIAKAIDLDNQALSLDPNNARVWAALADAYSIQANSGDIGVAEGYTKARQAVEKALSLDDNLADAHAAMGRINMSYDWDWAGANAEFRKALNSEPGNVTVIHYMAVLSRYFGKFEEAIALHRKAISLDPVKATHYTNLATALLYGNRLEEALSMCNKALELEPHRSETYSFIGRIFVVQGKTGDAITALQKEPENDWRIHGMALACYAAGRDSEADAALKELIDKYGTEDAFQIAEIYAYRGEADRAFAWLERAYEQRDGGCMEIKGDPLLKKIKDDPRYAAFLKKLKLPI